MNLSPPPHREEEEQLRMYRQLKRTIEERYVPLHRHLYQQEGWEVEREFKEAIESGDERRLRALLTEETPGM